MRPERRGVSTRSVIEQAKAKVSALDYADRLCGPGQLRRVGEKWVARCPLPEHADRSPSFTVYPETDSFFCFGCLVGGDVIELARHAWGYSKAEVAMAAADLLREFGHEVPQRPPAWYRKQERQRQTRNAVEQTCKNSVRRRLFEHLVLPHLDAIENTEEHNRELERAWDDFQRLLP
jgi:DNA primase